jgi:hypothetical protein
MDVETMAYALDQDVICEYGGETFTGKITGHSGENFIVTLDHQRADGTKTVLVPALAARPLICHWCQDAQKVPAGSFTKEQSDSGCIPQIACPSCTKN